LSGSHNKFKNAYEKSSPVVVDANGKGTIIIRIIIAASSIVEISIALEKEEIEKEDDSLQ
jgi:hypothetical protein